jgi:uncharacterized membrane protein
MAPPAVSDEEVELRLGKLLQWGVLAAAALVLAGGIGYLVEHGSTSSRHTRFIGEPENLKTIGGIVQSALALHARGLIQLGLLLLIATPVARVGFSLLAFLRQRDRTYVAITAFVLILLLSSIVGLTP